MITVFTKASPGRVQLPPQRFKSADASRRSRGSGLAGLARRFAAPALLTLAVALPADAATLYRYINDKGYQEIGYSVPPHLVPNGYDVIEYLDSKGVSDNHPPEILDAIRDYQAAFCDQGNGL